MGDYFIYNGELYHYGVKGMKWGVRRAQKKAALQKYRREYDEKTKTHSRVSKAVNGLALSRETYARNKYAANKKAKVSGIGSAASVERKATAASKVAYMDTKISAKTEAAARKAKKAADKAAKKLANKKMSELQKQYGKLENQYTYGKKADTAKNAKLDKQMSDLEREMKRYR